MSLITSTLEHFARKAKLLEDKPKVRSSNWNKYISLHKDENGFENGVGEHYRNERWFNYNGFCFKVETTYVNTTEKVETSFLYYKEDDVYDLEEINFSYDERLANYMDYKPSELVDMLKQDILNKEMDLKRASMLFKLTLNTLVSRCNIVLTSVSFDGYHYEYTKDGKKNDLKITLSRDLKNPNVHSITMYRKGDSFNEGISTPITDNFTVEVIVRKFKRYFYKSN